MNEREWLDIMEYNNYACTGKDAGIDCIARAVELAHGIADTNPNRRIYGDYIIDHPMNRFPVCGKYHNSQMNIGNKPATSSKLVTLIRIGKPMRARDIRKELDK